MKVLYVDDEDDLRELATLALELDPEMDVRSEASGTEALSTAEAWNPDVILLDMMMPNMDGPTTLQKLRENPKTATAQVIFITARAQAREVESLRLLGARGVITKPFDPMTLAQAVRATLGA